MSFRSCVSTTSGCENTAKALGLHSCLCSPTQHQAIAILRKKSFAEIFPWLRFAKFKRSLGLTLQFYDHAGALSTQEARAIDALHDCEEDTVRLRLQHSFGTFHDAALSMKHLPANRTLSR